MALTKTQKYGLLLSKESHMMHKIFEGGGGAFSRHQRMILMERADTNVQTTRYCELASTHNHGITIIHLEYMTL